MAKRTIPTASIRKGRATSPLDKADVASVLGWLDAHASKRTREEMAPRYGIVVKKAFGVPVGDLLKLARTVGTDHTLAVKLWATEWYEARMLASMIDDPRKVTAAQMDRWCADFDNWGIVDTVCFKLFDRTPHALPSIRKWARRTAEFQKRAAFALLACVALHAKDVHDQELIACLPLVEAAAGDERNFVKKAVSWALRAMYGRSERMRAEVIVLSERLAVSKIAAERWVGKDVLRQIARPSATRTTTNRAIKGTRKKPRTT